MVLTGLHRYPEEALARVVEDCGRLGLDEGMLLDEIGRHLMDRVPHMLGHDLVALVKGYAGTQHSPSILLFHAISDRLKELGEEVIDAEEKKAVDEAFDSLGYSKLKPF